MFDIIITNNSKESQICKYFENISLEVKETTKMKSQTHEKHISIAWPWNKILKLLFLQLLNSTFSIFLGPSGHSPFVQQDAVEKSILVSDFLQFSFKHSARVPGALSQADF